MSLDVFEEHPSWSDLPDDAADVRPQVPGIVAAEPLSGMAERLAGIAGSDEMNAAAPWAPVEAGKVTPDRSLCQGRVFHPGHESGRGMGFPLDVTDSSISGLGDMEPEVEAGVAGTQGDTPQLDGVRKGRGTYSHKGAILRAALGRSGKGSVASSD